MTEKIDEKTLETRHTNVHTEARNFEAQELDRKTVEALIEAIKFAAIGQGLAEVVAVCANFAHAAHSTLRTEASPAALMAMTKSLKDVRDVGGLLGSMNPKRKATGLSPESAQAWG